jgi:hypothetical protein
MEPLSVSAGMQKLISFLLDLVRRGTDPGERVLFLARSTAEMNIIAKYVDRTLGRSPYFSRTCYAGDRDRFCYNLAIPVPNGPDVEDGYIWIGTVEDATSSAMAHFFEASSPPEYVAWPDEKGVYIVVSYDLWMEYWEDEHGNTYEGLNGYRPWSIGEHELEHTQARFVVGPPIGWTPPAPPTPKVSVLSVTHLYGHRVGKEETIMAPKKTAAAKTAKKTKTTKKAAARTTKAKRK